MEMHSECCYWKNLSITYQLLCVFSHNSDSKGRIWLTYHGTCFHSSVEKQRYYYWQFVNLRDSRKKNKTSSPVCLLTPQACLSPPQIQFQIFSYLIEMWNSLNITTCAIVPSRGHPKSYLFRMNCSSGPGDNNCSSWFLCYHLNILYHLEKKVNEDTL